MKCSPAIVSNSANLAKQRDAFKKNHKLELLRHQQNYENMKAQMQFKVANRPLLVEQVSKAFIHNLNQIKELQRYVEMLRDAGMNPDEHLTEEQGELLASAAYYDKLNVATAYFPENGQNVVDFIQTADEEAEEAQEPPETQVEDVDG